MSTHKTTCIVCGKECFCSSDTHALGVGGPEGHGGCYDEPFIEFCSLDHALELQKRIQDSINNYHRVIEEDSNA